MSGNHPPRFQPFTEIHWIYAAQYKEVSEFFQLIVGLRVFPLKRNVCEMQSTAVDLLQGSSSGLGKGVSIAQVPNLTLNKVQKSPEKKTCSGWCETGCIPSGFWKRL